MDRDGVTVIQVNQTLRRNVRGKLVQSSLVQHKSEEVIESNGDRTCDAGNKDEGEGGDEDFCSSQGKMESTIMNSDSIPIDLIFQILLRLPAKSIARFHCVSKLWKSIFDHPLFSWAKPRLLFAIEQKGVWSFFSSPQHHNPYEEKSPLVVTAEFHTKTPDNMRMSACSDPRFRTFKRYFACRYASGLIYFYPTDIEEKGYYDVPMICNPNTGQFATLPNLKRYRKTYSFLGFDPIDKQFKVLFMGYQSGPYNSHRILTLGTGGEMMRWREIKCSLRHDIASEGICINGVLYYLGEYWDERPDNYVIFCFDVRSEQFKIIDVKSFCSLINYKGKLGVVYWKDDVDSWDDDVDSWDDGDMVDDNDAIDEVHVWVLEDADKHEWSKYVYTLKDDDKLFFRYGKVFVVGGTATGEIVFSMCECTSNEPFYVFYLNPERKNLQRVEIQGFGEAFKYHSVFIFANHVEDPNANDPKLFMPTYAPYLTWSETESEPEDSESESEPE